MYIDVQTDYKRLSSNTINHNRGAWLRIAGLIPSICLLYFPLQSDSLLYTTIKLLASVGILFSVYWEFFDGWLNKKRGYSWRFNGSDDSNDASSDNFLQKYTPKQQAVIKWGLILIFLTGYILIKAVWE